MTGGTLRGMGCAAAVAAALAPTLAGGCAATSGDFTVLSYNVAGLPQEISTENPEEHIPLISPLLEEYDVVLTQEDFDWWIPELNGLSFAHFHEWLRADTTHPYASAQWPGPAGAGIDPAVRDAPWVGDGLGTLSRMGFADETRVAW